MIDKKLIDLHQWIVDTSQKKPAWWAENLAWAYVAFGIIGYFLVKGSESNIFTAHIFWAGILLIAGGALVFISRVPAFFSMLGTKKFIRVLFACDAVLRLLSLMHKPENWRAAYLISSVLLLSYFYFTACQAPRPRHRRQAVAQGAA